MPDQPARTPLSTGRTTESGSSFACWRNVVEHIADPWLPAPGWRTWSARDRLLAERQAPQPAGDRDSAPIQFTLSGTYDGVMSIDAIERVPRVAQSSSRASIAVFQWRALQRPIRAARFVLCLSGDTAAPFS
jgi:hypothetical protein